MSLTLRPLTLEDAMVIHTSIKGSVAEYFYDFKTEAETLEWVKNAITEHKSGTKEEYLIFDEGKFIGMISPSFISPSEAEVGMWIRAEEQGKGYGKASLQMLIETLAARGITRLHYETEKGNEASVRLAESLGFAALTFIYAYPLDRERRALFESKNQPYPTMEEIRNEVTRRQALWDEWNNTYNLIEYLCGITKRTPERNLECFVFGTGLNTMSTPFLFPVWSKNGETHTDEKTIDLIIHELLHIFLTTNNKKYWEAIQGKYSKEEPRCRNHILLYAMMYELYQTLFDTEPIDFGRNNLPAGYTRAIQIVREVGYKELIVEYQSFT
jgi:RimJ/RimL family protein N-acetyltransferase